MNLVYSQQRRIPFSDCDRNNDLHLSAYLAWAAEIAGDHMEYRGVPRSMLLAHNQVFLLSKVSVRFLKPVCYQQNCTLRTWERMIKGVQFIRHYSLEDDRGEPCIQSAASWFLADPVSRKILRPSEYLSEPLLHEEEVAAEISRMKLPEFPETARHTILLTEIDNNRHMNNRFYGDLLVNYAPAEFFGKPLLSAEIAYVHEAYLGQTLIIHTAAVTDDNYAMYGETEDGKRCFDARATVRMD